jgi:hypothetical protein
MASWGLAPTGGRRPAARALPAGNREGGTDRWAVAQCRVAVPLTGGSGLSAARGRESRTHGRTWAGPRRKRSGRAQMNSIVLYLFELV